MAVTTAAGEPATKSTSAVVRGGARTVSEPAAEAPDTASEAGNSALQTMSRMIYTGSYALAYGVVYATVLSPNRCPRRTRSCTGFATAARQPWTNSAQIDMGRAPARAVVVRRVRHSD